jgi:apolipoprotein N-acyltransferase
MTEYEMSERPKEAPLGRSDASSASGQSKSHPRHCEPQAKRFGRLTTPRTVPSKVEGQPKFHPRHCEPQAKQPKAHINFILILISSILLSLSFSSFNLSYLAWIGLAPLFFALKDKSPKQSFILSYICGSLFFLFSMYWLIHVTVFGWLVLSSYQALYFGIFGLAFVIASEQQRARQSKEKTIYYIPYTIYFFIPSVWCLLEYTRANLFGGIGWNILAYSQYEQLPVIQMADITGSYGVSFLIVIVNLAVFSVIYAIRHKTRLAKPIFGLTFVLLIVAAVLLHGNHRIGKLYSEQADKEIKIALIQGNIAQAHKWDSAQKDHILDKYKSLTRRAAREKPDIIIWPETSIPGYLNKDARLMPFMERVSKEAGIPILAGAPMAGIDDHNRDVELNSAVLFSKKGYIIQRYNKLHLVMFGEFIPFERYFPAIRHFFPITGNFIPGDEYTLFTIRGLDFSSLICFEDIFPGIVRDFTKKGADFLVNITNDAWFGKSAAPYQHAANSVFRAVENRRPLVRSANTGLTCFIDRVGKLSSLRGSPPVADDRGNHKAKSLFVEGYLTDTISIYSNQKLSFYTKYGDIFILFCLLITGCFMIDYIRYRKYNN